MAKLSFKMRLKKREDQPVEWTKKRIFILVYTVIMVFYGFYNMIVAIQSVANFSGTITNYENMISNLEKEPIIDVKPRVGTQCDANWEPLFMYEWAGTSQGCDCRTANVQASSTNSTNSIQKKVYNGQCSANQTTVGCSGIQAVPAQDFMNWEINNNEQSLCVQRRAGQKYFKTAPSSAKCASGEKQCGSTSHPESIYCVKETEKCPIYEFKLDTHNNTNLKSGGLYEEIELTNSVSNTLQRYSLYVNRHGNSQPLAELKVTEGNGVCMDNKKNNIWKGHINHELLVDKRQVCSETDPRFLQVTNGTHMIGEQDYFKINGVLNQLLNVPEFNTSNTYTYSLYNRNFLQWKMEKRDEMSEIVSKKDSIKSMSGSQTVVMAVNIIVCILVSIILTMSQVYNLLGKDVPCIAGDGEQEQERIKKIKKSIKFGAKIFQLPFMLWAFFVASANKSYIRTLADEKLSDDITNGDLEDLATLIEDDVYSKNLSMLIVTLLVILLDIAIQTKKKIDKSRKSSVQPEANDEEKPVVKSQESEVEVQQQQQQNNINDTYLSQQQNNVPVTAGYTTTPGQQQYQNGIVQQPPTMPQGSAVQQPPPGQNSGQN